MDKPSVPQAATAMEGLSCRCPAPGMSQASTRVRSKADAGMAGEEGAFWVGMPCGLSYHPFVIPNS